MYGFEVSIYFYICEYDCVRMSDWGGWPVLRLLHWSLILLRHGHWKPKFVYRIAFSVEDVLNYFSVFQRAFCFSCFLVTMLRCAVNLWVFCFPTRDLAAKLYKLGFNSKDSLQFQDMNFEAQSINCNESIHISHSFISQRITSHSAKVDLVGDRLCYDRIAGTGAGPDSGWVWGTSAFSPWWIHFYERISFNLHYEMVTELGEGPKVKICFFSMLCHSERFLGERDCHVSCVILVPSCTHFFCHLVIPPNKSLPAGYLRFRCAWGWKSS